jgi:hypothetical protein
MSATATDIFSKLTIDEIAMLALTNDGRGPLFDEYEKEHYDSGYVLTTKDSYIWGVIFSSIVESDPNVSSIQIFDDLKSSLIRVKDVLKSYYANIDQSGFEYTYASRLLLETFVKNYRINSTYNELEKELKGTFDSLIRQNLIQDPVFTEILGVSIAILGFIPHGFTKRTKRGRIVYKKIESLYWYYEKQGSVPEDSVVVMKLKVFEIVKAFGGLISNLLHSETTKTDNSQINLDEDDEDGDIVELI